MYNILYQYNEPIQRGNISIIFKLKDSSFEYASKMSLDKAMIPKSELSAAKQICIVYFVTRHIYLFVCIYIHIFHLFQKNIYMMQ